MTINEYQTLAMRTANKGCRNYSNAGLGLAGEAGECVDIIKKHLYHGHKLDKEKLKYELGDVCWYVALLASLIGENLDSIMIANVEKLKERYPDGFSHERSINRKENEGPTEDQYVDIYGEYVNKSDAAEMLGVTRATVYTMIKDGRLITGYGGHKISVRSIYKYMRKVENRWT